MAIYVPSGNNVQVQEVIQKSLGKWINKRVKRFPGRIVRTRIEPFSEKE